MQALTENKRKYLEKLNPYLNDFQVISRRQVELAIELRAYRCKHQINQTQAARIATAYGSPYKISFTQTEISSYERYTKFPTEKKMMALLNMIGIDVETLDE